MTDWNGTGPVEPGMRLSLRKGNEYWRKFIVKYISDNFVLGHEEEKPNNERVFQRQGLKFEPVLTDRDVAIEDMSQITGKQAGHYLEVFGEIYDAGYRK